MVTRIPLPENCSGARFDGAEVDQIMLHFCSTVVEHPQDPFNIDNLIALFNTLGVSSHYLIARNGAVIQFVEEDRKAYHAGKGALPWQHESRTDKMNDHSIGIEMLAIGTQEEMAHYMTAEQYDALPKHWIGYTDAQYKALNHLIGNIRNRWPLISLDRQHIVGHDDYAAGRKVDPGKLFDWSRIGLAPLVA